MQQKAITGPSYIIRIGLSQNSDEVDDNADKGQPHGAEVEYAHQRLTLIKFVCIENAEQQTQQNETHLLQSFPPTTAALVLVFVFVFALTLLLELFITICGCSCCCLISSTCGPQEVQMTASAAIIDPQCLQNFVIMFIKKTSDNRNNICGKNVAAFRKELHISQRELADRLQLIGLDIDKNAIQRIESGQRFVTDIELCALSRLFGRSYCELLTSDHSNTE